MSGEKERMILGSGELFAKAFTGEVPEATALCVDANRLAFIKGGASLEYKASFQEAQDDLGRVKKTILVEEEATLKSGACTINANVLDKLIDTGRVTETATRRTIKIGGIGNATNQNYAICFWHKDEQDGDIWVTVLGRNQAGLTLSFAKDKETVVDVEFKCEPLDDEGTLIIYEEEIKAEG